jgi:malonyl-CoA/methylmalonyl-CoA synthetase
MSNPLSDALFAPLAGDPARFLILPDGATISRAAFHDRAAALAGALAQAGARPGDRVAAQIDKSPDALALWAACVRGGFVFLPLNPAYTPSEVAYFLSDAEPAVVVAAPGRDALLVGLAGRAPVLTLGQDGDGTLAAAALQAGSGPVARRGDDDLAAILYTSGTTGRPKGAMITHRNLVSNARALTGLWGFAAGDVLLHPLPVFHTHGLFVATHVALLAGAPILLLPRFDADALFRLLPQATAMMGVPTFYTRLVADPRLTRAAVAHMRLFISGSAPLLPDTHRAFTAATGQVILERYGMTETNMITSNPLAGDRRPGSVGLPLPGVTVRVGDPAGQAVPPGETGMIEVRGPNVFKGYWRQPEKTAEDMRPDGFFITGDLGVMGADGHLTIVGRAKDLIIAGGFNIYPAEVEAALDALPGVLESAVVGVPHPDLGEAVVALVVPRDGADPTPEGLAAGLAGGLARFKQPRRIILVDRLPRNAMGKVQKAALRADYRHLFGG